MLQNVKVVEVSAVQLRKLVHQQIDEIAAPRFVLDDRPEEELKGHFIYEQQINCS